MPKVIEYWFKKTIVVNLILIYLVIIAGSIVRSTGSGMGCPDWPTCFGQLIPPTSVEEVTWQPNALFNKGEMIIKDKKLFVSLDDFKSTSSFNVNKWVVYEKHDYAIFNPFHTWVEFINRLVTVVLGFPILLMLVLSCFYIYKDRVNIYLSLATVFMVAFQAFLGKIVVDRNLQGTTITYHMLGVFILIILLLWLYNRNKEKSTFITIKTKRVVLISLSTIILSLLMIILGTQVREEIDAIAKVNIDRSTWISELSYMFYLHRSAVWLIIGLNGLLWYNLRSITTYQYLMKSIIVLIFLEAFVGVILVYLDMPAFSQPLHLLLASLLFGVQVYLYLRMRTEIKMEV